MVHYREKQVNSPTSGLFFCYTPAMQVVASILNLPWTIVGLALAALSLPFNAAIHRNPFAFVFRVRSFWWYTWLPSKKGLRGTCNGVVILLGPKELQNDLAHELIHIEQYQREPFIHPFLYELEMLKKGYRQNKYEVEAYDKSDSVYIGQ